MSNVIQTTIATIKTKMVELEAAITNSTVTLTESIVAQDAIQEMFANPETLTKERFQELSGVASLFANMRELEGYEATLALDLMHVETAYVVTNSELISPAGFHPDTKVFVQTKIAIHMNDIPTAQNTPSYSGTLYSNAM